MVIVKLLGGLGNQLFQYAAGRALAHRLGVPFKLDITAFESYDLHAYALDHLNIQDHFATPADLNRISHRAGPRRRLFNRIVQCATLGRICPLVRIGEEHFTFNHAFLNSGRFVYLDGFWQTQRYFKPIQAIIRREFTQKTPRDGINQEYEQRIQTTPASVSLHVRRADYVTDATATATHGLCRPDYYRRCAEQLCQQIGRPHLFVFSDDIVWAKAHLHFDVPMTYVGHNDASRNYEDLFLMSQCRHHIIANSTFSWWGAWLNPSPDKLVYAPSPWFDQSDRDESDVVPSSWIKVSREVRCAA